MSRFTATLPPSYFDDQYAGNPDPWQFTASLYEREKYAATLAALPRPRYASALEVGCSIGVLTEALATRCDALVGLDLAELALIQARERCRDLGHVRFARAQVPGQWPDGSFDLIVLSEVVYFLDAGDVERLIARVKGSLRTGGDVVLVHWTGETHYPLSGDEAAERVIAGTRTFLRPIRQTRTDAYRLDVLAGIGARGTDGQP
ncbi:class I SAM-dependent DNA methyltransferase [Methylobacterium dankookense]|uniref:Ubiquinone biosynthesis O-methyltransferase n=2 Tax=Methylobacterium dankookense TaxID=560405 RepID=A0A564FZB3_9HYPH|nr:class I SAM-dependent methyltransferase [Methylobacterium dankookense]VUF13317.1 Ubiquinone biosynthesis O-methyltransferase [Methylobacterium dankookense]